MHTINNQVGSYPVGDQYFSQSQQRPVLSSQVFPSQINPSKLPTQQKTEIIHGVDNNPDIHNSYLLKQKLEIANLSFGQQTQQTQQSSITGNNLVNAPPGVSIIQPRVPNLAPSGNLPPQIAIPSTITGPTVVPPPTHLLVREVWDNNLNSEFASIRKLISQYNLASISIEFVGTIARPIGNFRSKRDYHYQTMRSNVDLLNPIQIGISLCDYKGNKPENIPSTWQFNLKFDMSKEMVSAESLELFKKSGINFEKHQKNGVDSLEFAHLLIDSGLLLSDEITWLSYHAAYDFGFLINLLMNQLMPNNKEDYEWWIHMYMPNFYDLNLLNKFIQDVKKMNQQQKSQQQSQQYSLENLSDELGIPRFSIFTTTGGQSLLTLLTFIQLGKLSMNKLPNGMDFNTYKNLIYGITNE